MHARAIGPLPDTPADEHAFGPGDALDTPNLKNSLPRDRRPVVKRPGPLGHYPQVGIGMTDYGRDRVAPADQESELSGGQEEQATEAAPRDPYPERPVQQHPPRDPNHPPLPAER
jgi:hypothetical protein